ncbi:hypothetical protein CYMTET_36985 [Cymbomonas tetramitiformis]|uniref:Uncharacterized protein n=1 Tax=Cymbomonas tetramitiformis TaxID=36881 RepID=A0AAE0CGM9_9CHLO|nr:hypothetical protein CYMTET_36985 [Cymbomonas tetramitiformis]
MHQMIPARHLRNMSCMLNAVGSRDDDDGTRIVYVRSQEFARSASTSAASIHEWLVDELKIHHVQQVSTSLVQGALQVTFEHLSLGGAVRPGRGMLEHLSSGGAAEVRAVTLEHPTPGRRREAGRMLEHLKWAGAVRPGVTLEHLSLRAPQAGRDALSTCQVGREPP